MRNLLHNLLNKKVKKQYVFLCISTCCYICLFDSRCNSTHIKASEKIEKNIQESLPQLFQDHLMCAGVDVGNQGACQGDSGGPLMYNDDDFRKYIQIATVRGGVGDWRLR
jgi:hypothetical protein